MVNTSGNAQAILSCPRFALHPTNSLSDTVILVETLM